MTTKTKTNYCDDCNLRIPADRIAHGFKICLNCELESNSKWRAYTLSKCESVRITTRSHTYWRTTKRTPIKTGIRLPDSISDLALGFFLTQLGIEMDPTEVEYHGGPACHVITEIEGDKPICELIEEH